MRFTWVKETAEWERAIPLIAQVPWPAGAYLARQMENNKLRDWEDVLICWENEELVGFCALLRKDILKETALTPFISMVFVSEKYRGKRMSEKFVKKAEQKAYSLDFKSTFITTQHVGLYEKFGYHKIAEQIDIFNRCLSIYQKNLIVSSKDDRRK
ncbi:GNAT family N-acetyltransferase [Enterococcus dispar]|uniref:GNAT family N-acetyltransferase n=1 Tax=Enterococcus dispar TaxID=44009 RepID=UPI0021D438B3|nr:GNAT family N-acetyltransferase [Enterococcus dispar]MCU7358270.1 GNAT family N-acetyltransferase [Enterococcus dispar]MDT2706430.1 GNAT family N-acetyltransferase [Enterococcus dispar]